MIGLPCLLAAAVIQTANPTWEVVVADAVMDPPAAGVDAARFTSPSAVGKRPCARTAAIAELRSPASICPRVSLPDASLAIY